jgi:hypothetical protein
VLGCGIIASKKDSSKREDRNCRARSFLWSICVFLLQFCFMLKNKTEFSAHFCKVSRLKEETGKYILADLTEDL